MAKSRLTIKERLVEVIVNTMGVNPELIVHSASLTDDIGADKLDQVNLVLALEEEFELEITDEQAAEFNTVGDMQKFLDEHLD